MLGGVVVAGACAGSRAFVPGVPVGEATLLRYPSAWSLGAPSSRGACPVLKLDATERVPDLPPLPRERPEQPEPVRVGQWTVTASFDDARQLLLQADAGELRVGPVPVLGDTPIAVQLVPDDDAVVIVGTHADRLIHARWQPSTGSFTHAPSTVVDELPICKSRPGITDAITHDGLVYVALLAAAAGEHGPCGGYTEKTMYLSATVVISRDGLVTKPMRHPLADAPTRLGVVDGTVVGRQEGWFDGRTAGFRIGCVAQP